MYAQSPSTTLFSCPICEAPLVRDAGRFACRAGHSFDVARSGYVNLLPSHHRKSQSPGDDVDMVRARSAFLGGGYYEPLAERIVQSLQTSSSVVHADLGCGEGYFTNQMSNAASDVYGIDISKPAITQAAKRFKQLKLAVASVTQVPLQADQFDSASIILAPFPASVIRILRSGARLIRVTPGSRHLVEFKRWVYAEARTHPRAELDYPGLQVKQSDEVAFTMTLDAAARGELYAMTPMAHRAKRPSTIPATEVLSTSAHFWIDVFERQEGS